MRRKSIFIGSSSEELTLAEEAKKILSSDFDVTLWNDRLWDSAVFKINQNFLNDLLKASLRFDFGILLGTSDDKVTVRGTEMLQPRDNVLFELGLFMGRLGLAKCAFIIEKDLRILSDVNGISLARFKKGDTASFSDAIQEVKELFAHSRDSDINFFPSSTLASVYFENLIVPTCRHIITNNGFDKDGTKYKECQINIVIPKKLNTDVNLQMEQIKGNYQTKNVSFHYAGRPRHIHIETEIKNGKLIFMDFPTILSGINYAIANLLPNDFNAMSADYDSILSRELDRFVITLKELALRHGFDEMICITKL